MYLPDKDLTKDQIWWREHCRNNGKIILEREEDGIKIYYRHWNDPTFDGDPPIRRKEIAYVEDLNDKTKVTFSDGLTIVKKLPGNTKSTRAMVVWFLEGVGMPTDLAGELLSGKSIKLTDNGSAIMQGGVIFVRYFGRVTHHIYCR